MRFQFFQGRIVGQVTLEVFGAAEGIQVSKYGIALNLTRVLYAQMVGVGVHALHFFLNLVGGIGKVDTVAQRLAHLGFSVRTRQAQTGCIVRQKDFRLHQRVAVDEVEAAYDFTGLFNHRFLVFADGNGGGAERCNVRGLADGVAIPVGTELIGIDLDCSQTGWGFTPVIGLDAKFGKLTIGAKYEFKANLNIENNTKLNSLRMVGAPESELEAYKHGVNTPNDIPAMLSVAAAYEFLPVLRASVEYHFYDDKNAGMADGKQKYLTKGTNEYLAGIEWDVIKRLTLSGGVQFTDYGLSDNYQTDTSFSCDSYSLGIGAKLQLSERADLNVGYMWTNYEDYTKTTQNYNGLGLPGTNVYSRTNKVFGLSIDYRF